MKDKELILEATREKKHRNDSFKTLERLSRPKVSKDLLSRTQKVLTI